MLATLPCVKAIMLQPQDGQTAMNVRSPDYFTADGALTY